MYIVFKCIDSKWLKNSKTTRRVSSLYSRYRVHLVVEYNIIMKIRLNSIENPTNLIFKVTGYSLQ